SSTCSGTGTPASSSTCNVCLAYPDAEPGSSSVMADSDSFATATVPAACGPPVTPATAICAKLSGVTVFRATVMPAPRPIPPIPAATSTTGCAACSGVGSGGIAGTPGRPGSPGSPGRPGAAGRPGAGRRGTGRRRAGRGVCVGGGGLDALAQHRGLCASVGAGGEPEAAEVEIGDLRQVPDTDRTVEDLGKLLQGRDRVSQRHLLQQGD